VKNFMNRMFSGVLGRLVPLVLIVLVAGVVWWAPVDVPTEKPVVAHCADLHQGCDAVLAGKTVHVSMQGDLKALTPFLVQVEARGVEKVEARFTMEGMDMGFNLYILRTVKPGIFQGRVTLPVCVTGRRDWIMQLELDGKRLDVPFFTYL